MLLYFLPKRQTVIQETHHYSQNTANRIFGDVPIAFRIRATTLRKRRTFAHQERPQIKAILWVVYSRIVQNQTLMRLWQGPMMIIHYPSQWLAHTI